MYDEVKDTVTAEEAKKMLSRFNASHWNRNDKERARYSIPANPRYDDDIRMGAFIEQTDARIRELEEAVRILGGVIREHYPHKEWGYADETLKRHMGTDNQIALTAVKAAQ